MRLRAGLWAAPSPHGTILLFSGRSEYLEKYGRAAAEMTAAGYSVLSVDWRGQGYSDRLTEDARLGHVGDFSDYQKDVAAFVKVAEDRGLPKPWYLVAHSMGGCIGLRALINDLPVERAVFSAPMWGIFVFPHLRPIAKVLPGLARAFGQSLRTMPGTGPQCYVLETEFEKNLLTTDKNHWEYLNSHARASAEIALGGPTIHWFEKAREEMPALYQARRPTIPVLTLAGTREGVVDRKALTAMHQHWPSARLEWIDGGRHELMMEAPEMRQKFMSGMFAFLEDDAAPVASA